MMKRGICAVAFIALWGCQNDAMLAPDIAVEPRFSGSGSQSFTVQAFTSMNGAFWIGCTSSDISTETWTWNPKESLIKSCTFAGDLLSWREARG